MSAEPSQNLGGALAGMRVVDLSRVLAGPFCSQLLADHGAEVIKIEPPQGDETRHLGPPFVEDTAAYFIGLNRNKRAMALDLRQDEAREILLRLLAQADVLIENFVPGTMERWGLGYTEVLAARFPQLVYCQITGFGADGPLGGLPGYDAVLQAVAGLMSINGSEASGPMRIGVPIVDLATGQSAATGILLALMERSRSGLGQKLDVALFDTALGLLHPQSSIYFVSGQAPSLTGSGHPSISPYDKYATKTGDIFLGVVNDGQFRKFCNHVGHSAWATDPRFMSARNRLVNRDAMRAVIETALADFDGVELCEALMRIGVPAGAVNSVPTALAQAHTQSRKMTVELEGYRGLGIPLKLSRTPGSVRNKPPAFGADNRKLLGDLGFAPAQIDALFASGAVCDRIVKY